MDAYIGHSNMGLVPAISLGDVPILSVFAGPPYPVIIPRSGNITSFAAQFSSLAAVDLSLFSILPGIVTELNQILSTVAGAVGTLVTAFNNIAPTLASMGSPLPSDYADILNAFIIDQQEYMTAKTNHHMHAVLWHAVRDATNELGGAVNWQEVADLDLGAIPFLALGPFDTILSAFGDIVAAGTNVFESLLSLFSSRGTPNQALNNMPLNADKVIGLAHPIKSGDYLMVQFTLKGEDNNTILAGVFASNLMASAVIQ